MVKSKEEEKQQKQDQEAQIGYPITWDSQGDRDANDNPVPTRQINDHRPLPVREQIRSSSDDRPTRPSLERPTSTYHRTTMGPEWTRTNQQHYPPPYPTKLARRSGAGGKARTVEIRERDQADVPSTSGTSSKRHIEPEPVGDDDTEESSDPEEYQDFKRAWKSQRKWGRGDSGWRSLFKRRKK